MGENINNVDMAERAVPRDRHMDEEKGVLDKDSQLGDNSGSNGIDHLEPATSNPQVPTADYAAQQDSSDDSEDEGATTGLGRFMSRVTSRSSIDPGPPPDGGRQAWAQCKWP